MSGLLKSCYTCILEKWSQEAVILNILIRWFETVTGVTTMTSMFFCFCLFVLGFYGPVNNEVTSGRSVNSRTVPGQV